MRIGVGLQFRAGFFRHHCSVSAMSPLTQRAMEPTKHAFCTSSSDQEVESATAPDGHVRLHNASAPPFSSGLPSGLARSQQLYMMQRFLNIPATPSYVKKDNGLVLDRVVMNVGGRTWWQTLTLRLRAQRAWNTQEFSKGKPHQVLSDPSMYALGGRFRVGFGANTVLRGLGELGSLSGAVEDFSKIRRKLAWGGGTGDTSKAVNGPGGGRNNAKGGRTHSSATNVRGIKSDTFATNNKPAAADDPSPRGRITLQTKVVSGHLVSLDASLRERYQTNSGYEDGPSFVSASVQSRGARVLNYKFGVRHWLDETLPKFERGVDQLTGTIVTRPPPRREATVGASLEHQVTLWRGTRRAANPDSKWNKGYAALPQTPRFVVGGLVGGTARLALRSDDETTAGTGGGTSGVTAPGASSSSEPSTVAGAPTTLKSVQKGTVDHRQVLSLTAHASFGSFSKPVLDYTAVDVRYDLSSCSSGYGQLPSASGTGTGTNDAPAMDALAAPKTAMEKLVTSGFDGHIRVASETFTVGATQQLLGPVRLRAEIRFGPGVASAAAVAGWRAMITSDKLPDAKNDGPGSNKKPLPGSVAGKGGGGSGATVGGHRGPGGPGGSSGKAFQSAKTENGSKVASAWRAASAEICDAELVYGIDVPLPPALGAARLVAWYNVKRGEAMAEMRLFDL